MKFQATKNQKDRLKFKILEQYRQGLISLNKLAELLDVPLEEAKIQLQISHIPLDSGISDTSDLLRDVENA